MAINPTRSPNVFKVHPNWPVWYPEQMPVLFKVVYVDKHPGVIECQDEEQMKNSPRKRSDKETASLLELAEHGDANDSQQNSSVAKSTKDLKEQHWDPQQQTCCQSQMVCVGIHIRGKRFTLQ